MNDDDRIDTVSAAEYWDMTEDERIQKAADALITQGIIEERLAEDGESHWFITEKGAAMLPELIRALGKRK